MDLGMSVFKENSSSEWDMQGKAVLHKCQIIDPMPPHT